VSAGPSARRSAAGLPPVWPPVCRRSGRLSAVPAACLPSVWPPRGSDGPPAHPKLPGLAPPPPVSPNARASAVGVPPTRIGARRRRRGHQRWRAGCAYARGGTGGGGAPGRAAAAATRRGSRPSQPRAEGRGLRSHAPRVAAFARPRLEW